MIRWLLTARKSAELDLEARAMSSKVMRRSAPFLLFFLVLASGGAEQEIPSLAPTVRSVFPHGLKKGTTAEIEFHGQNLDGARSIEFFAGRVKAHILSSSAGRVRARVTALPDAETGTRDFRLTTARGSYVGLIDIGSLGELNEFEPNDSGRQAQKITLPATVNGVIDNEDWDYFQFHADADETLAFDVLARRNGSKVDADLAILDANGRELAWNDDHHILGDPRIEHRFEKPGKYIVRVGSMGGSPSSDYRLVAGRVPYLRATLPAGFQRGKTTEVVIHGFQLQDVSAVWIGDRIAVGTVLSKSADMLRASMQVSASVKPGNYWLHVATPGVEGSLPIMVTISDWSEITVTSPPSDPAKALPIAAPVVVNGALSEPRRSHFFSFHAEANQRFEFRVDSMRLGYHTDPVVTLFDAAGKRLTAADDPGTDERSDEYQLDPRLGHQFQKAGMYLVAVRDAMYRGDSSFIYRLSVISDAADFQVEVREPLKTVYIGQNAEMLLRVVRLGSWDAPVEVWAEGLPAGVSSEKQIILPKDSVVKDTCGVEKVIDGSIGILPIRATGVKPALYHFTVKARGAMNDRIVERTAISHYEHGATGYRQGPMQEQRIDLTVMPAPKVILTVPEQVSIMKRDKPIPIKVSVGRFLDARETELIIRAKSIPDGVTLEPVHLGKEARQTEVLVSVSPATTASEISLVLLAEDVERRVILAESSAIFLKIGSEVVAQ